MERQQLIYAVETAKTGNITKAADHLHVSQPTLSIAIRNLEEELGISLFERCKKRVTLTEAGEAFIHQAEQILREMNSLSEAMRDYANIKTGHLKIGALPIMVTNGIPEMLETFQRQHPGIHLFIQEEGSHALLQQLKQSELDAAFIIPDAKEQNHYNFISTLHSPMVVIASSQNPLAGCRKLHLKDLANQNLIVSSDSFNLQRNIQSRLEAFDIPYQISTVCSQIETCIALAEKNMGITICSEITARHFQHFYRRIHIVPLLDADPRTIQLAWVKPAEYHPALQSFIAFASDYYKSFDPDSIL